MVSWTITHKDVISYLGLFSIIFMLMFTTFAVAVGFGHILFVKDLTSGNQKLVQEDIESAKNMTKMHFTVHEKDAVNIIISIYYFGMYFSPIFFFGLIFYVFMFSRYDDKLPRKMIQSLSEWLMRRVNKQQSNREVKQE